MGGGDLNSKKSWHPHTLKNQEQVWKAEQAKAQEEKKLNDLRKEIQVEKDMEELARIGRQSGVLARSNDGEKKLDWMYKNSKDLINRDEYLLGRKVDKSFEILQEEERQKAKSNMVGVKKPLNHVEHECVPFSIRAYKNAQITEQVDIQRKFMEDPLMLIKQREMESRRKILENPVKLKELHRMLKTDEKLKKGSKKSKRAKKKSKSKKRNKKSKSSPSASSSSDKSETDTESESDLDSKLAKKLKGGILDEEDVLKNGLNINKLLDSKYEKISQELDKAAGKSSKKKVMRKLNVSCSDSDSSGNTQRNRNSVKNQSFLRDRSCSIPRYNSNQNLNYNKSYSSKSTENSRKSHSELEGKYVKKRRSRSLSPSKRYDTQYNKRKRKSRSISAEQKVQSHHPSKRRSPSRSKNREIMFTNRRRSRSHSRTKKNTTSYLHKANVRYSRSRSGTPRNRHARYSRSDKRQKSTSPNFSKNKEKSNKSRSRSPTNGNKYQDSKDKSAPRRSRSRSPTNSSQKSLTKRTSKLSDEEKQAKLREMMSNAAWREDERTEVVRKHREAYAREEQQSMSREFDKDFLNKEVKKAMANQTSVGSRLKANLNNIQRTSAAMNSNFVRK